MFPSVNSNQIMLKSDVVKDVTITVLRSLTSLVVVHIRRSADGRRTSCQGSIPVSQHDQVVAFWHMCQRGLQSGPKCGPVF